MTATQMSIALSERAATQVAAMLSRKEQSGPMPPISVSGGGSSFSI